MAIAISTTSRKLYRSMALVTLMAIITAGSVRLRADTGTCGGQMLTLPFTDVPASSVFFCSIAEAFFLGLTNGTTATTYSPEASVTREQTAAFITRTHDSGLRRGSRRAALNQWWAPASIPSVATTTLGSVGNVLSDGADLWVTGGNTVSRVRASDGRLIETWTGANQAFDLLVAFGRIYVTGSSSVFGSLYVIDPKQTPGAVSVLASNLGGSTSGVTTDGTFIWTASPGAPEGSPAKVCKVHPDTGSVTDITAGLLGPNSILYDGSNIWVTDVGDNTLKKLNADGTVAQSVQLINDPEYALYDGTNIWVIIPASNAVTVVRAATGTVLTTLTGNGLSSPRRMAFDGGRMLVTNVAGFSVSLWNAADLSPLGTFPAGMNTQPYGACSDGLNFWVTLSNVGKLARL